MEHGLVRGEAGDMLARVDEVAQQMRALRALLERVLVQDVDYGIIPGCAKPCLYLPGAEKLLLMAQLRAEISQVQVTEHPGGHREYRVDVRVHDRADRAVSDAIGIASTLESKWRYRWEATGELVPQEYWKTRDPQVLGGADRVPRKVWHGEGRDRRQVWMIYHRVEHGMPADYYHTVQSMAHKRALVRATRAATAAGSLFDLEPEVEQVEPQPTPEDVRPPRSRPRARADANPPAQGPAVSESPVPAGDDPISREQRQQIVEAMMHTGKSRADLYDRWRVDGTDQIRRSQYQEVLEWARS